MVVLTKYNKGEQVEGNEVGCACGTCVGESLVGNSKGKRQFDDQSVYVDKVVVLIWILGK